MSLRRRFLWKLFSSQISNRQKHARPEIESHHRVQEIDRTNYTWIDGEMHQQADLQTLNLCFFRFFRKCWNPVAGIRPSVYVLCALCAARPCCWWVSLRRVARLVAPSRAVVSCDVAGPRCGFEEKDLASTKQVDEMYILLNELMYQMDLDVQVAPMTHGPPKKIQLCNASRWNGEIDSDDSKPVLPEESACHALAVPLTSFSGGVCVGLLTASAVVKIRRALRRKKAPGQRGEIKKTSWSNYAFWGRFERIHVPTCRYEKVMSQWSTFQHLYKIWPQKEETHPPEERAPDQLSKRRRLRLPAAPWGITWPSPPRAPRPWIPRPERPRRRSAERWRRGWRSSPPATWFSKRFFFFTQIAGSYRGSYFFFWMG